MHRRSFLAGLVSVVGAPSAAGAEQRAKTARIGLLDYATFWDPLRQGLRELNYVEGQNIAFEYRPDGREARAVARSRGRVGPPEGGHPRDVWDASDGRCQAGD